MWITKLGFKTVEPKISAHPVNSVPSITHILDLEKSKIVNVALQIRSLIDRIENYEITSTKRYYAHKDPRIRSYDWTTEMDDYLKSLCNEKGFDRLDSLKPRNWKKIATKINTKFDVNFSCGKITQHYDNVLNPAYKRSAFSLHEDFYIMLHVACIGKKWSFISKPLCRVPNWIKNRFYTSLSTTTLFECIKTNKDILRSIQFREYAKLSNNLKDLSSALELLIQSSPKHNRTRIRISDLVN